MCGLVGFISKSKSGLFPKDVDIFEDMLHMDTLRGDDATGICMVTPEQGAKVLKEASAAYYFMWTKDYNDERKDFTDCRALLGHNRKATMGGKGKDENAHPFVINNRYVFFHNGTLHNHKALHDTEVDSEALGMVLTECEGHKEKLEECLGRVFGAYACVWYDTEKNHIYFIRNKDRPLSLLELENGDFIYSSEPGIAYAATMRRGSKVKTCTSLDEHSLYTLDLDSYTLNIEQLTPKKAKPQATTPTKSAATTVTKSVGGISKNTLKKLKRRFLRSDFVTFTLEDAISSVDNPAENECVDWYLLGNIPEEQGVEIHAVLKDKFEHEILPMFKKLGTGKVYDTDLRDGKLHVYLNQVQFHKKREIEYVH